MKKKFLAICVCALALVACGESNEPKHESKVHASFNMTDDQMFAYLLGNQFGGLSFINAPEQFGEYLDLDAVVQGIYDNAKYSKDHKVVMQLPLDSMDAVTMRYKRIMDNRVKLFTPDSATMAAFGNDMNKVMLYVDSVRKTLPLSAPVPVKNQPVVVGASSSENLKYSYVQGVQLNQMFEGVAKSIELQLDVDYFVLGFRESSMNFLDSSFAMQVPMDSLKAVNGRYVARMREISKRRRAERMGN